MSISNPFDREPGDARVQLRHPQATSNSVSKNEPATAPTEIAALALRERNPPKPMTTAEKSGSSKMSHAAVFIGYSFIVAKSATSVVWRLRYRATISANPTDTSAAATVMMKTPSPARRDFR